MKKVLYMVSCNLDLTGTPVFIRDLINNLGDKYTYSIYTPMAQAKEIFRSDIEVIEGNCSGKGFRFYLEVKKNLERTFCDFRYDIVHINTSNIHLANLYVNFFQKKSVVVICHSHNVISYKNMLFYKFLIQIERRNIVNNANKLLACSSIAGKSMYGENSNFIVVNNFIELNKFHYSADNRAILRAKFPCKVLLGHVGAFNGQKNQMFLISIMEVLNKDYSLVLIGEGKEKASCINYCRENHLNNIYFVDACDEIGDFYSAFDIFLFPSLFEGFGRVLLEAEVSNLNIIASDQVPRLNVFECDYLPLKLELWINKIIEVSSNLNCRYNRDNFIKELGYDSDKVIEDICSIYR